MTPAENPTALAFHEHGTILSLTFLAVLARQLDRLSPRFVAAYLVLIPMFAVLTIFGVCILVRGSPFVGGALAGLAILAAKRNRSTASSSITPGK